jgi:hypothetical protein
MVEVPTITAPPETEIDPSPLKVRPDHVSVARNATGRPRLATAGSAIVAIGGTPLIRAGCALVACISGS